MNPQANSSCCIPSVESVQGNSFLWFFPLKKKTLLVLVAQEVSLAFLGFLFLIVIYACIQQAGLVLVQLYSETPAGLLNSLCSLYLVFIVFHI